MTSQFPSLWFSMGSYLKYLCYKLTMMVKNMNRNSVFPEFFSQALFPVRYKISLKNRNGCKLYCCVRLKSSHLCLLIETVSKCNRLKFAVELMPTWENQDDSRFQIFFSSRRQTFRRKKKKIDIFLVSIPFSVKIISRHLYTLFLYNYVVSLQHNITYPGFITPYYCISQDETPYCI